LLLNVFFRYYLFNEIIILLKKKWKINKWVDPFRLLNRQILQLKKIQNWPNSILIYLKLSLSMKKHHLYNIFQTNEQSIGRCRILHWENDCLIMECICFLNVFFNWIYIKIIFFNKKIIFNINILNLLKNYF